jgi:MFS family permease
MAVAPEQAAEQFRRDDEGANRSRKRRRPRFGNPKPGGITAYDKTPYGWAPVVILVAVAIVDRVESSITSGVLPLLQDYFQIGDAAAGAIPTAVTIAGAIAVLPAGYLADRYNRTNLISLVVLSWAFFLVFNALAMTFAVFFAIRVILGAADSIDNPASSSLLGDYYSSRHRPFVYGWARLTTYVGSALGTIYAGVMGQLYGWRLTYLFVMIPALICAWLCWQLREPVRGFLDELTAINAEEPVPSPPGPDDDGAGALAKLRELIGSLRQHSRNLAMLTVVASSAVVLLALALSWALAQITDLGPLILGLALVAAWLCWRYRAQIRQTLTPLSEGGAPPEDAEALAARQKLRSQLDFKSQLKYVVRIPTLRWITVGFATLSFGLGGIGYWVPTLLFREFGLDVGEAGALTGTISMFGLVGGTLYGSRLGRVWHGTRKGGRLLAGGGGLFVGSALFLLSLAQPSVGMFALVLMVAYFFMALAIPNMMSSIADVLMATSRGIGFSLLNFVIAATAAWGPMITGLISDAIGSLHAAMYILGIPGLLGAGMILYARQTFDRDAERVLEETRQAMADAEAAEQPE